LIIRFGKHPKEVVGAAGGDGLHFDTKWDVSAYARLIAKVAVGFAVAALGPPVPPRTEMPLIPVILGHSDDPSVWLGTMPFTLAPGTGGCDPLRTTQWVGDPERSGRDVFVARVKLFANSGASGFGAVVWRPELPDPRVLS
jgi:hypothetical protein